LRDLVNKPSFILLKKLDMLLYRVLGRHWIPLYSMVTFSRIRYHEAVEKRRWQDAVGKCTRWSGLCLQVVSNTLRATLVAGVAAAVGFMALRYGKRNMYV